MTDWFPFDPAPRRPHTTPPALACDGQFHVFGPADRYPVRPGAAYEMPSATFAKARQMHAALGLGRGVIVQATTYGTDYSAMLDALAEGGANYRGCVVLRDSVTDAELHRLHDAGVRGTRFNFSRSVNYAPDAGTVARTLARVRELGWYVKLQLHEGGLQECLPLFDQVTEVPIVIDHMARVDMALGLGCPTARLMLQLLARGNWWVMLSNGHKLSRRGAPWDDAVEMARAFIEAAPARMVWASDWPHPLSSSPVPNDADLLELLYRYAPDKQVLQNILVDNPARVFGFDR